MSIFNELDPNGPPEILLEREVELNAARKMVLDQLRKMISEEALEVTYTLLGIEQDRSLLCGVRTAHKITHKTSPETEVIRTVQEANTKRRIAERSARDSSRHVKILRGRIMELEKQLQAVRALPTSAPLPLPEPAPTAAPDWDYPQQAERKRRRDEVITHSPFSVEVVARQVEETVKQFGGRCMKPDVSARLPPEARPHLSAAYKHLHASRRVRVDGWNLSIWTH